ncbi:hypothetical protein B0O99DRAFT_499777 [Bisporella sp. PMI_857]|nr:hypothetical protein B0O99DRAFT_499777 [Bisporella sp. PMI_857]
MFDPYSACLDSHGSSLSFRRIYFRWAIAPFPRIGESDAKRCRSPAIRREWRTLRRSEQLAYITAVSCLRNLPSIRDAEQSLYDDFPYTHSKAGNYSHNTQDFLLWHRLFLHVFETALRERCGYQGHLIYWDWSLDAEDLTKSPVFDNVYGFGGNGNSSAPRSVGNGHCVTEGPFAHMEAFYFGDVNKTMKHCFSRGFISSAVAYNKIKYVGPDALEDVLSSDTYDMFYSRLEHGAHNAIPLTIRGDFLRVTAPYDPVFYLHHTQLDRLWHRWQLVDSATRIARISGNATRNTTEEDMLARKLDVGDLAAPVRASEMLDTRRGRLCYIY